jgi:hypothetical protein
MKSLRTLLLLVLLGAPAVAQSEAHHMDAPKTPAPKSEAQLSFDTLKSIAGEWEGSLATDMPEAMKKALTAKGQDPDGKMHISLRVTSRGNVLVHEMQQAGTPFDASKYDHPVTMMYVDQDKLNLVHYCDAGNRPHMVAKASPAGRVFDFDFADLSGSNQYGHMFHATFTIVDANHHIEEWTYMTPNDVPMHARFDLRRVGGSESASLVK